MLHELPFLKCHMYSQLFCDLFRIKLISSSHNANLQYNKKQTFLLSHLEKLM